MAVQLSARNPFTNEITSLYGVIDQFNMNKRNKEALITVEFYLSHAARLAKARPISNLQFNVVGDDYESFFAGLSATGDQPTAYALAYEYVKHQPELNGAIDA